MSNRRRQARAGPHCVRIKRWLGGATLWGVFLWSRQNSGCDQLHAVPLGKIHALAGDFTALEKAMAEASEKHVNVICHELYVTEEQDFILVLMTHQA